MPDQYNKIVQIMSEQDLTKCLQRYFKEPSIDHRDVSKLISFIQDFAHRGCQSHMVQKIFRVAEMTMMKENLKTIIKRYLYIMNEILERDDGVEPKYKYRQAVSGEIVHQYIALLRNALNYGPTDLLSDMKLYRKRWAKRINDEAYSSLQLQALRQLKFDLDKGFSDEIVRKLAKSYQKRQFSKTEVQKYLPMSNNQTNLEVRKSSTVSSSSSQREGQPRKKLKLEEQVAEKRNESSDMVMSRHSFIPSNSNTYGNGSVGDPRRLNQIMYPSSYQNVYPPPQYAISNRVINPGLGQKASYIGAQQTGFYPATPYNTYNYPNYNYGQVFQNFPPPGYHYQRNDSFSQQMPPKLNQLILKMEKVKKCWSHECKSCGIFISTGQKYDEHMLDHFLTGQKQYQVDHSRTDHSRKANKPLLPSLQQWIQSNRVRLADQKFQVAIEGDVSGSEACAICKGELKVSWSDKLESWVFEDAIRTRNTENLRSICHSECFHTIDELEKSSDELVR